MYSLCSKAFTDNIFTLDSRVFAEDLARETGIPDLVVLIRRFLFDQVYPEPDLEAEDVPVQECPSIDGKVRVYRSARATWYAPSELAGPTGMHAERLRSTPSWNKRYERRDTVLVQYGAEDEVMQGFVVARVLRFMSVTHATEEYPCALVEWLVPVGQHPDPVTGMWIVQPLKEAGRRAVAVIHLDCIARSCHIIGVSGKSFLRKDFKHWQSHLGFKAFYLNRYSDYHMHETGP